MSAYAVATQDAASAVALSARRGGHDAAPDDEAGTSFDAALAQSGQDSRPDFRRDSAQDVGPVSAQGRPAEADAASAPRTVAATSASDPRQSSLLPLAADETAAASARSPGKTAPGNWRSDLAELASQATATPSGNPSPRSRQDPQPAPFLLVEFRREARRLQRNRRLCSFFEAVATGFVRAADLLRGGERDAAARQNLGDAARDRA